MASITKYFHRHLDFYPLTISDNSLLAHSPKCNTVHNKRPASHRRGPGLRPGQSMWDLWWTKWHWDRFFSKSFGFLLSISFLRCSIFIHMSPGVWTKCPLGAKFRRDTVPPYRNNNNKIIVRHGFQNTTNSLIVIRFITSFSNILKYEQ
jgi:hypothetical protein